MRWVLLTVLCVGAGSLLTAQENGPWQMQDAGTTASLRGIDAVDGKIAWASGTGGTVLRTTDGGAHWTRCAVPDAALDFRGVQGFNAQTAIVMASGPGARSALYKTSDGCATWNLLFANPDTPNGFFDSFWFNGARGIVVGDPVNGKFVVFLADKDGRSWKRDPHPGLALGKRELAAFAASNSGIAIGNGLYTRAFATGGKSGSFFFSRPFMPNEEKTGLLEKAVRKEPPWRSSPIPVGSGTDSSGTFSVAYRYPVTIGVCAECTFNDNSLFVAVGGELQEPWRLGEDSGMVLGWRSNLGCRRRRSRTGIGRLCSGPKRSRRGSRWDRMDPISPAMTGKRGNRWTSATGMLFRCRLSSVRTGASRS